MKQKVLFVLLNGYADWGAFLSTALHVAVIPDGEIKYEVHTVAPTLDTVRPIGGFRTLPDYSFENMPKDYAALVLIGGNRWDSPEAELVAPLVKEALDKDKIVGAICNGASFLCSHGFLNHVKHTLMGQDPMRIEYLHDIMYRIGLDQTAGDLTRAVSHAEIALWDILSLIHISEPTRRS